MIKRGQVLAEAIADCERFIRLAKAFKPGEYSFGPNRTRAAAKRASMDASMSLARLRKAPSEDWAVE